MASNLQQRIEALNEQYTAEVQTIKENLAEVETKRESLRREIEQLRSELAQVDVEFLGMQEDLETFPERYQRQSVGTLVVEALTQSQKDLVERLNDMRQIQEQREQLGADIPDLAQALQEFQSFEDTRDHLAALPDSYRGSLLAHHEELKQKLQPHFDLLELEKLVVEQPLKIVLVLISKPQDSQINWVLPLPPTAQAYPAKIVDLLDEFSEMSIYVILRLGQHPDWYFASMDDEDSSWQGFSSQVTLMEYSGDEPMAAHAAQILQDQFDLLLSSEQSGPLQGLQVVVEVASIPQDAWKWTGDLEYSAGLEPEQEPEEPLIPLFERSHGWYTDDDVTAWERPLKVTEESDWNIQGRRLRTALINLLSRGLMGSDYVDQQYLWQALPPPHQEAMREGIDRLLEHNLLQRAGDSNGDGETLVTVNPEMVGLVQDLINRQVDGVWQSIVNM